MKKFPISKIFKKITLISRKVWLVFGGALFFLSALVFGAFYVRGKIFVEPEKTLKIGVVTDFEYGYKNQVAEKLTSRAPEELAKVVEYFNSVFRPEAVISGGDMVESSLAKKDTTIRQFQEINEIFSRLEARKLYALGNHDLRNLNKEEVRNLLGLDGNHTYLDLGDWRLVVLDSNFDGKGRDLGPTFYSGSRVSQEELEWLREVLRTDRPAIVFVHHPPFPVRGKNLINGAEVAAVIEEAGNVVLVVSGHDPDFKFNQNRGINYLVVDNLANVDSVGSFASLEARYNSLTKKARISVEHYGPKRRSFTVEKDLRGFRIGQKINSWY